MSNIGQSTPNNGHESPDLEVEKMIINAAEKRMTVKMFIGLIGTLLGIIGHHIFLFFVNGHRAESQFWIKTASNAFSQVVVLFMGFIAMSSLTQLVWQALTKEYTRISIIDELFSLPSPLSIVTICAKRKRQFILTLVLSLVIQSLVAVSILAPNSLTVSIGHWANVTSTIPTISFFAQIPNMNADGVGASLDQIMGTPLEEYWEPPAECEASCQVQLQYQAPSLSCRILRNDELRLSPFNRSYGAIPWVYYDADHSPSSSRWGNPYPGFWMNYVPHQATISDNGTVLVINQTAPIGGIQCDAYDANYQATFKLVKGVKSATASVKSYASGATEGCSWTGPQVIPSRCGNYSSNANAIHTAFTSSFISSTLRNAYYETVSGLWMYTELPITTPMKQYIHEDPLPHHSISILVPDLARTFEELYSNVTLASMLSIGDTEPGSILASDGQNVWSYSSSTFWTIYGIALGFILALALGNLHLVANHNVGIDNEFSSFLISTRSKSLDKIYSSQDEIIVEAKLRFSTDRLCFDTQEPPSVDQNLLEGDSGTPTEMPIEIPSSTTSEKPDISANGDTEKPNGVHPDKWALIIMIVAYLMAVFFSVAHHMFLWKINKILISHYSQFWVKNISNGLAHAVSLCLGLVAAYSLTQAIWRTVKAAPTSVAVINRLFSLPATEAYFRFLISSWRPDWIPTALIVLTTYMLLLVTIFAPNALTVGTSPERTIQVKIPAWNYTDSTIPNIANQGISNVVPNQLWSTPSECEAMCQFQFEYEAPGLICTDYHVDINSTSSLDQDEWRFIVSNYTGSFDLGNLTNAQYWAGGAYSEVWKFMTYRPIWIQYFPSVVQMAANSPPVVKFTGTPVGSLCQIQDATYRAEFHALDGVKTISTHPISYSGSFSDRCPWDLMDFGSECEIHGKWSFFMMNWFNDHVFRNLSSPNVPGSSFSTMSTGIVNSLYNVTGDGTFSLELKVSNISNYLVELFSNYTQSLLAQAPDNQTINALTGGNTVWQYDARTLWGIYGTSHALILIVLFYGLYCIWENGMPLDKKFSTLMIATRGDKLNSLVEHAESYDVLKAVELRYESKGGFVVVEPEESENDM